MKPTAQLVRYACVGVFNTMLHLVVVVISLQIFELGQMLSNGVAYLFASTASFFMNARWSFMEKPNTKNFSRFQSVSIAGLVISSGVGYAGDYFHWHFIFTVFCVALAVPFVSFVLHRKYTFYR
jgi:putative flippase GtrA